MEFRFILDNGNEFRELLLLNKVVVKRNAFLRVFVPLLRIALTIIGVFFLLTGCVLLFGDYDSKSAGVACTLVGVVWTFLGLFYYRYGAWRSHRMTLKNVGSIIISLTEHDIVEVSQMSDARFGYDAVRELYFYRDTYFLFLDRRHALILPLAKLSSGQAELLEQELSSRCGKTLKKL